MMKCQTISGKQFFTVDIDARRNHYFSDLHIWLHKHAKGKWTTMSQLVGFELEEDAMFFKLAWKG